VFSNGWEKIKLKEEAISEIPLTLTPNHVLRLAMLKKSLRKKKGNKNSNNINNSSKPRQKLYHRLQQVAEDYQTGDHVKEHKYSSFCWSSKRYERKVRLHT